MVLTAIVLKGQTRVHLRLQFYGAVVMILLALLQAVWLAPSMSNRMAVREGQDGVELELRSDFRIVHVIYIGVDAVKALLLIYLNYQW